MRRPFFSCVIPVKGARPYFEETIASLKGQGMGEELEVVVQDGDVERDIGQSDALNKGFAKAKGAWLFWLNADDVLLPNALMKVRWLIDHVEFATWIAGNTIYIDVEDRVIEVRCDAKWRPWFGKYMSVWTGGPSAFFRRELLEKYGGFDTSLKYVMDIDLWTRWACAGEKFVAINDYLWGFRVHDGSATFNDCNQHDIESEFQAVLGKFSIHHEKFWRNISRVQGLFDGTRWHKLSATSRLKGKNLRDCVVD